MDVNRGIVCGYSHILISLLMIVPNSLGEGDVRGETVCLHDRKIFKWNLTNFSKIAYAYIKHGRDLIVNIQPPNVVIIDEKFEDRIQINFTESVIEMTIHNVTFDLNGEYTCTIGSQRDLKIHKEISLIDPGITLSLKRTSSDCKTLICYSKYNVSLLGPNKRKFKSDVCLSKEENGRYSCCLVNESMCLSTNCKYIDVKLDEDRNTEKTTQINGISYGLDHRHTYSFGSTGMAIIIIFIVVFSIVIGLLIKYLSERRRNDKCFRFAKRYRRPNTTVTIALS